MAKTLQFLGYEPEWQDIFGTEQGDLHEMLRRRIDGAQGVVQLVGRCYGAEPPTADPKFGRVSYTQFEALYAHQRSKKVWYLMLDDTFSADPHEPESEEFCALQEAYRKRVGQDGQLNHPLNSAEALETKVLKLRDDLALLRRGVKRWAWGVAGMLVLSLGIGGWLVKKAHDAERTGRETKLELVSMKDEIAKLGQGVAQYRTVEEKVRQEQPGQKQAAIEEKTYADLAKLVGVDAKTLREKLPEFARKLQHAPEATTYERANAAYVAKDFAESERLAVQAADEAQKAVQSANAEVIKALELAGWSAEKGIQYTDALRHFREAEKLTDQKRDFAG